MGANRLWECKAIIAEGGVINLEDEVTEQNNSLFVQVVLSRPV